MKWKVNEIDKFLQAKEYVDTAVIPLIPIGLNDQVKSIVAMGEFISIITEELERQFQGRIFQFPAFTYLKSEEKTSREQRLESWYKELKENGFQHFLFLTSDYEWKTINHKEMEQSVVWLPTLPLENLDKKYRLEVVSDQIKQLIPIIMEMWKRVHI